VIDFTHSEAARLLELLGQEQKLFNRVLELTEKQAGLLAADDIEAFDKSLDGRQELIEEIDGLHQELDVLMQSYVLFSASSSGGMIEEIQNAVAERYDLIARCVALNGENEAVAKEKAEDYIKRIGKLSLSRKSIEVYAPDMPDSSILFDEKS